MKLLIDTHALIWFLQNDPQLSRLARNAIEDSLNERWISTATGWEIAIKSSIGKLRMPLPFNELFPKRLEDLGFSVLGISPEHLHLVEKLPLHHRDPFDRLLVAQTQAEGLVLVSRDEAFDAYGVKRIWQ